MFKASKLNTNEIEKGIAVWGITHVAICFQFCSYWSSGSYIIVYSISLGAIFI